MARVVGLAHALLLLACLTSQSFVGVVESAPTPASASFDVNTLPPGMHDPASLGSWVRDGEYCGSTLNPYGLGTFYLWTEYYVGVAPLPGPMGCCGGWTSFNGVTKRCVVRRCRLTLL